MTDIGWFGLGMLATSIVVSLSEAAIARGWWHGIYWGGANTDRPGWWKFRDRKVREWKRMSDRVDP